jgi:hypothetical protein
MIFHCTQTTQLPTRVTGALCAWGCACLSRCYLSSRRSWYHGLHAGAAPTGDSSRIVEPGGRRCSSKSLSAPPYGRSATLARALGLDSLLQAAQRQSPRSRWSASPSATGTPGRCAASTSTWRPAKAIAARPEQFREEHALRIPRRPLALPSARYGCTGCRAESRRGAPLVGVLSDRPPLYNELTAVENLKFAAAIWIASPRRRSPQRAR